MGSARPKPILIIAILLIVLALVSTTSTLTSRLGFARRPAGTAAQGGNFQGGGNNNNGGGNFQGGGNNNGGGNFQGGGGNFAGRGGGFNAFSLFRTVGINGLYITYISLGFTILGIILALLSAFGVWKQKRWALNLAMLVALVFLIGAAPGLFTLGGRNINLVRITTTILSVVASVPILVYGILPSVRDTVS
jgi:hypothetical protein